MELKLKKTQPVEQKPAKKRHVRETVEAIVIALILALFIRGFVIQAFKIPSGSMEDTLLVGDHILVSKFSYGLQVPKPAIIKVLGVSVPFFETRLVQTWGDIERGDVVVFRFPGDRSKDYIKRVVGLPGDAVEVKEKSVYINGRRWEDPYGVHKGGTYGIDPEPVRNYGPYTVPKGRVLVMGDNRDRSYDSRYWGTVPIKDIKGEAFIVYWSWDGERKRIRFGRIADIIH